MTVLVDGLLELTQNIILGVEYTYGTPMSVLPSFAERKR